MSLKIKFTQFHVTQNFSADKLQPSKGDHLSGGDCCGELTQQKEKRGEIDEAAPPASSLTWRNFAFR